MGYQTITYERRDTVGLLTLNRPDKLNAWTPTMAVEQAHAIEAANADPQIGAIVMTGAGRGFCAGADMEDTFKARLDGKDPGDDTAGGVGGMPATLDWVGLLRRSKPTSRR
jgi:enoyl-CoA hydratase/carnithine racemase